MCLTRNVSHATGSGHTTNTDYANVHKSHFTNLPIHPHVLDLHSCKQEGKNLTLNQRHKKQTYTMKQSTSVPLTMLSHKQHNSSITQNNHRIILWQPAQHSTHLPQVHNHKWNWSWHPTPERVNQHCKCCFHDRNHNMHTYSWCIKLKHQLNLCIDIWILFTLLLHTYLKILTQGWTIHKPVKTHCLLFFHMKSAVYCLRNITTGSHVARMDKKMAVKDKKGIEREMLFSEKQISRNIIK